MMSQIIASDLYFVPTHTTGIKRQALGCEFYAADWLFHNEFL